MRKREIYIYREGEREREKKGERLVEFVDFGDSPLKGLIIAVSAEA